MENFSLKKELVSLVKSYARDMRVLLADDNDSDIEFYRVLFGKNFNVFDVTHNGKEAIDLFKSKPRGYYDLVVTDVDMPVMNGLELVKEIRNCSLSQSIIVLTGVEDLKVNQSISFYCIDGLLPKPIDSEKLYALLYRVLKRVSDEKDYEGYVSILENNNIIDCNANKLKRAIEILEPLNEVDEVKEAIQLLDALSNSEEGLLKKRDKIKHDEPEPDFIDDEFFDFESEDVESAIEQMHLAEHEKITAKEFMSRGLVDSDTVHDVEDILEKFKDATDHLDDLSEEYLESFKDVIGSFITILNISYEFKDIAYGLEKLYTQTLKRVDLQKIDRKLFN